MSVSAEKWVRWRARLGFPVAAICLWFALPTQASLLVGSAVALAGLLIRGAAAGHLRKGEALATSGPYARTRNPLYLGSALLAAGFVVVSRSWLVAALVVAYFFAFYPFLMRREEMELRARFGASFNEYAGRVPLFWPRLRVQGGAGAVRFSLAQYVRNGEYRAAVGMAVVMAALWALALWGR